MRAHVVLAAGALLLALLLTPILVAQLDRAPARNLIGPALEDTHHQVVRWTNAAQGLDLAGLLFWPSGGGPFPAVVVIHGSGESRRENPWYLAIATGLQREGIAVLLPDKRGCGQSGGDWRTASFQDLATDAEAAVTFLRETYGGRINAIGVLGASQGGQVVPIVASKPGAVDFAVNVVGSVMPFHAALVYEERWNLRGLGVLPGVAKALAHLTAWNIRTNVQPAFWNAIGNYDPRPYWRRVEVPALSMFGSADTNTDTPTSVANLSALDNPHITIRVFEGSGHALEDPPDRGNRYLREDALAALRAFVLEVSSARGQLPPAPPAAGAAAALASSDPS